MTEESVIKKSKTITDRIIGSAIASKDIVSASIVDDDEELKEKIRNRIVFWFCIGGGLFQAANLIYTFIKLR